METEKRKVPPLWPSLVRGLSRRGSLLGPTSEIRRSGSPSSHGRTSVTPASGRTGDHDPYSGPLTVLSLRETTPPVSPVLSVVILGHLPLR